jgi:hypothetical protein
MANRRTRARPKLGYVFTQTTVDEKGYTLRDGASTSYVGAIEGCEAFGRRLLCRSLPPGLGAGGEKMLGDGADWIWNQTNLHFPEVAQIVDLCHARPAPVEFSGFYGNDVPPRNAGLWSGKTNWMRGRSNV